MSDKHIQRPLKIDHIFQGAIEFALKTFKSHQLTVNKNNRHARSLDPDNQMVSKMRDENEFLVFADWTFV